jgi:hypothetical protein
LIRAGVFHDSSGVFIALSFSGSSSSSLE